MVRKKGDLRGVSICQTLSACIFVLSAASLLTVILRIAVLIAEALRLAEKQLAGLSASAVLHPLVRE